MSDSTRTEDVEERVFPPITRQFVDCYYDRTEGYSGCYDCGRRYGGAYGFPDLIVPDEVWERISPTGDQGGLLCPSCIVKRLAQEGIECEAVWKSGPLEDCDLRERMEECREFAEESDARYHHAAEGRNAARRRADRLEEAVREADERLFNAESGDANDEAQTIAELRQALADARGTLRSALDSREGEGAKEVRVHYTGSEGPLSPEVEQALAKVVQRIMEQEPVHADEPEGDEKYERIGRKAVSAVRSFDNDKHEIGYQVREAVFGEFDCSADDLPPTDEPVTEKTEDVEEALERDPERTLTVLQAMPVDTEFAEKTIRELVERAEHWRSRYQQAAREISDLMYVIEAAEKVVEQIPAYEKSVVGDLADALDKVGNRENKIRDNSYRHMCRSGHPTIGFDDDEGCPLCDVLPTHADARSSESE